MTATTETTAQVPDSLVITATAREYSNVLDQAAKVITAAEQILGNHEIIWKSFATDDVDETGGTSALTSTGLSGLLLTDDVAGTASALSGELQGTEVIARSRIMRDDDPGEPWVMLGYLNVWDQHCRLTIEVTKPPVQTELGGAELDAIRAKWQDGWPEPSMSSSTYVSYGHKHYAVLRNVNGVIAVFDLIKGKDGSVLFAQELAKWPVEIEDY
jgi:hypothetical protein